MSARYRTDLPCRVVRKGGEYGGVVIECAKDAAYVFAGRHARKTYGQRGYCHHVRHNGNTLDGRRFDCEAFIGVRGGYMGVTNGKTIRFTVEVLK